MDNATITLGAQSLPSQHVGTATTRLSKTTLFLLLLAAVTLTCEIVCRFVIGLGDPPLYQADPTIEYVLQPSKTYYRFHKRFSVNRYSMRADDFPLQKSTANELRVLVIGDSVVYGGVMIDQSDIATEILKRNLHQYFNRPVVVENASAKGWGPPSELAYLKRYGTFHADLVILELSSHDYADVPTSNPVGTSQDFPAKRPAFALTDLFETYLLPRYLHLEPDTPTYLERSQAQRSLSDQDIAECRDAERDLFSFARSQHAKVALAQHLTVPELRGNYYVGYYANQAVAQAANVPYVDDSVELRAQLISGDSPFFKGDAIHLNKSGQYILARALQRAADLALKAN